MRILKRIVEMIFIFLVPLMLLLFGLKINKVYDENNNLTSQYLSYENGIFREYKNNLQYNNYLDLNQLISLDNIIKYNNDNQRVSIENNQIKLEVLQQVSNYSTFIRIYGIESIYNGDYFYMFDFNNSNYGENKLRFNTAYYNSYYGEGLRVRSSIIRDYEFFEIQFGSSLAVGTYYLKPQIVNISQMFYRGNNSIAFNDFLSIYGDYKNKLVSDVVSYESNSIVSGSYEINYTWYNNALVSLSEHLQFNNNYMIQFIFIYVILIMLNLLLWYVFYVPFDMLFGLLLRKLEYYK